MALATHPTAVGGSLVDSLVGSLDTEQAAAATLPDGPAQIIAPAGSGKTTTLIARLGVLLARGVAPAAILVVTFNREAAAELSARIAARLGPLVPDATRIEVRTLHALARQVLLDTGAPVNLVADRLPLLRAARRRCLAGRRQDAPPLPEAGVLDTVISAWKVEGRLPPDEASAVIDAYAAMLAARGAIDFDDLVLHAVQLLETDAPLRLRWQTRFSHVCVDEFQDVDAGQLRMVRLLAAPQDNLFVVGDDDQTIYAWRLADVRRILDFALDYPAARRVQLATNYRCPPTVVAASRQLIDVNRERFAKRIEAAPGAAAIDGSLAAFATSSPDWPEQLVRLAVAETHAGRRACFLARTRTELAPISLALIRAGVRHASSLPAPAEAAVVVALVDDLRRLAPATAPFHALLRLRAGRGWRRGDGDDALGDDDHAALDAALGWAVAFDRSDRFLAGYDAARTRLGALRDPAAPIELVTVHGAKGREWHLVVIVGFEDERFPNRRALVDSLNPDRSLEEERRLAYVALTRATRRLVLAFDPSRPSRFMAEMGATGRPPARPR
ncbi:MAG TPA: ATP-dependent helicase [Candidatus Limnocylindria bacterium]|nr:ATP-dependent helicase [Candidatus Limnocylindria bacterium]